jgi:hypothetical protein
MSRNNNSLYFILSCVLLALMMFLYSFTPFLNEGQDLFAEVTLGGSFILSMLILPIYMEYFHGYIGRSNIFPQSSILQSGEDS